VITVTLRSPEDGRIELAIATTDGCEVLEISADQLRLLAEQSVVLLCRHVERAGRSEARDSGL
jgi:hypothetical protein